MRAARFRAGGVRPRCLRFSIQLAVTGNNGAVDLADNPGSNMKFPSYTQYSMIYSARFQFILSTVSQSGAQVRCRVPMLAYTFSY
jgi:hypothetical protein